MRYVLKPHAIERMKERAISKKLIEETLRFPTKILYDDKGRILFKKLYKKRKKQRLLLIAGEEVGKVIEIITVIDTTRIKKYL
jgi:hypothetical protein